MPRTHCWGADPRPSTDDAGLRVPMGLWLFTDEQTRGGLDLRSTRAETIAPEIRHLAEVLATHATLAPGTTCQGSTDTDTVDGGRGPRAPGRCPERGRKACMIGRPTTDHHPGFFTQFTSATANYLGRPWIFAAAVAIIIAWAVSGPFLDFSDTWQLIINTLTTLVTFLMVFIIQNTQNRDSAAVHLKLDTIMRVLEIKDPVLYDAENRGEAELEELNEQITPDSPPANREP
jgi:low affinity Fe/Cu permease